jgi:hypothetical protein
MVVHQRPSNQPTSRKDHNTCKKFLVDQISIDAARDAAKRRARMTDISWASGISGDWSTQSDWDPAQIPGSSDSVTIGASGTYTVTISTAEAVDFLNISAAGATVEDEAAFTLGSFTLGGGVLGVSGTFILDGGTISGGSIAINGGTFQVDNGTLFNTVLNGPGTITVASGGTLTSDNLKISGGSIVLTGGTITGGTLTLDGTNTSTAMIVGYGHRSRHGRSHRRRLHALFPK